MTVKLILPFPDSALHAHATGHWTKKKGPVKAAREEAKQTARVFLDKFENAEVEYIFYVKNLRSRDEANMVQMCKPYIDGCVDAGLIQADDWQHLHIKSVSVFVDRLAPRVELIFSELVK